MKFTLLLILAVQVVVGQRREGERCRRQDRTYGTCKLLRECPKAEIDFRQYQTPPEFCDFSISFQSQVICCPDNADNEIHERTESHRNDRSNTQPSLDSLLFETGLNSWSNNRDYSRARTTQRTTTSRAVNQNNNNFNYYNQDNERDVYGDYTTAGTTTRRTTRITTTTRATTRRPTQAINNPSTIGVDRNARTKPTADDLFEEAYRGQPTIRPDRPKRRDGPRISMQKCEEYKRLSKKVILFSPLLVNPTPVKKEVPLCDATVPLIVGGDIAKPGEFPSMAALGYSEDFSSDIKWRCGGTLISENYILTAGHCVKGNSGRPTVVRLGENNLATRNDGANPIDFGISEIITHPSYSIGGHYYDIALIKLSDRVEFTSNIRPSCLWQTQNINSTKGIATGWGSTGYTEDSSDNLLKVDLNIFENKECKIHYNADRRLSEGIVSEQLCAGVPGQGKDTCLGDSGGPLQVILPENPCVHYVVGVTSFGKYCGGRTPGVYSRVSSYIDWIENIVWN